MIRNIGRSWRLKHIRIRTNYHEIVYRGLGGHRINKTKPVMIGSTAMYTWGPFAVFKFKEKI